MDIFGSFFEIAFGPGDGSIFLVISVFIGLAAGRLSSLWLAVLFAVGMDVAMPGAIDMIDGSSFNIAHELALDRLVEQNGSGVLFRTIGYFGSISLIVLLKKGLGNP